MPDRDRAEGARRPRCARAAARSASSRERPARASPSCSRAGCARSSAEERDERAATRRARGRASARAHRREGGQRDPHRSRAAPPAPRSAARAPGRDARSTRAGTSCSSRRARSPCGSRALGWDHTGRTIPEKQAAAAVGQIGLCELYQRRFARHGRHVAQVLVTRLGLDDRERYLNARHTLTTLLELGVVPIVNENDTVATEEIRFGDNDNLSATIVNLVGADLLVILTDVEGLYERPPAPASRRRRCSAWSSRVTDELRGRAGGPGSAFGRGGMMTKLQAAAAAGRSGAATVLATAAAPDVLLRIARGEPVGTLFLPGARIGSRKHWLAFTARPRGTLLLDDGAVRALRERGRSLLPAGVVEVSGEFGIGDPVRCVDAAGPRGRARPRRLRRRRGRAHQGPADPPDRPGARLFERRRGDPSRRPRRARGPPETPSRHERRRELEREVTDLARRAREAPRARRAASARGRRTPGCCAPPSASRRRATRILAANRRDLEAGAGEGPGGAHAEAPRPRRRALDGHARGPARGRGARRSRRRDHAAWCVRPNGLRVGRMRIPLGVIAHHLRVAAQRDGRRRGALREGGQRGDPARRLRGDPLEPARSAEELRAAARETGAARGRGRRRAPHRPRGDRRAADARTATSTW